jgi:pimeloyl-ACP methyl ester carboxylesterase
MNHDALTPGTHTFDVDGIAQSYVVAGHGPVCIAHSGGPGVAWEYLRMPELEKDLTMVYIVPIGTGSSGRLNGMMDYTADTYAYFLNAVVDHLAVPRPFLIGHSHGGFVAQRYELDYPGRLGGLVLYATSPFTGDDFSDDARANLTYFTRRLAHRPQAADLVPAFEAVGAATDDETLTAAFRRLLPAYFTDYWANESRWASLRASARLYRLERLGSPRPFDVRDELSSIRSPTLIIAGPHDFICGVHWAGALRQGIRHASYLAVPDAAHMIHLEQPEVFADAVRGFVKLHA